MPFSFRVRISILSVFLFSITLWVTSVIVVQRGLQEAATASRYRLNFHVANLQNLLRTYDFLPDLIADNVITKQLLRFPQNEYIATQANQYIHAFNQSSSASGSYILSRTGTLLASSNWEDQLPFISQSREIKPSFRRALFGLRSRQFSMDLSSQRPSIYFFSPVYIGNDAFSGVAIVKADIDIFEVAWSKSNENVLVTDLDGVIIFSSEPSWRFKSLADTESGYIDSILQNPDYEDIEISPLPVVYHEDYDQALQLMTVDNQLQTNSVDAIRSLQREKFLVRSSVIPRTEWIMHVFTDIAFINNSLLFSLLFVSLISLIIFLVLIYLFQRRKILNQLEIKVDERTKALSSTNAQLRLEITDRIKAESELRQTQGELVQAGKLAAIGQLSASINHEVNQPLTAILTYIDSTLKLLKQNKTEGLKDNLKAISELSLRMAKIVGHLKKYIYKSPDKISSVLIWSVIDNALLLLRSTLNEIEVVLNKSCSNREILVFADSMRLEQVVINIISNAVDAMRESKDRILTIDVEKQANKVLLRITDSGGGIDPSDENRVFDAFFTTKCAGEGLGLGLSISHRIIESFEGCIYAKNANTGGAEFTVELLEALPQKVK